jgi:hypothetical protein
MPSFSFSAFSSPCLFVWSNQPGATTAHSLFKIPVQEEDNDTVLESNVKLESARGTLLRAARLLTWDEMPAAHIAVFEAIMRLLRRLHSGNRTNDIPQRDEEANVRSSSTSANGGHNESPDPDDVYAQAAEQFANEPAAEDEYFMEEELDQDDCYFMATAEDDETINQTGTLPVNRASYSMAAKRH